jgi:uncharacterized protein (TIGR02246 family)
MKNVSFVGFVPICLMAMCSVPMVQAADQDADKAAIEKVIVSYTAAFNARDAKALAGHWSAEAVYTNPVTGSQVEGREEIEKEFTSILADSKDSKLSVDVESIRFISPSVAVENGVASVVSAGAEPQKSNYTAIHVKRDGKWFLDRVREEDVPVILSHYEQLKQLEWLIGSWVDGDDLGRIETTCKWTKNKNFITRTFTASDSAGTSMSGMQIIGWDASAKQIRSWVFDSDGGFSEGHWTSKEKRWYCTKSGTLADGKKVSSVNVITYVDADQFKWKSVNRTVAGKLLPNIDEVVVVRSQFAK